MRIDAHTHPFEGKIPERWLVRRIVNVCVEKNVNFLGITEHLDSNFGFQAMRIAGALYPYINIVAGCEIDMAGEHIVELYFPYGTFRLWCHPRRIDRIFPVPIHAIEIENSHCYPYNPDAEKEGKKRNLILFKTSDAHDVEKIGLLYTDIDDREIIKKIII